MATPPLSHRRRSRRTLARLATVLLIAFAAWIGGLFWFAGHLPDQVEDPTTRTDAIVVLTGDGSNWGSSFWPTTAPTSCSFPAFSLGPTSASSCI